MVSLAVVLAFLLLIAAGRAAAWWPATGSARSACPMRRPASSAHGGRSAPAAPLPTPRRAQRRPVATSTRWRPATPNGPSARRRLAAPRSTKLRDAAASAPTGWAATCWPRPSRARRSRSWWAWWRRCWPPLIGTLLGALAGFFGGRSRRPARVGLQRLHLDPRHPADLRACGRVHRPRQLRHGSDGGHHPGPDRLDRHLPAGARRVHQARARASTCARPRRSAPAPARACSATSCPTSATWCWCSCRS